MSDIRKYTYLTDDARYIQTKVFVDEQSFRNEFDDKDDKAVHFVMYNEAEKPVATCRVYEGADKGCFIFGRIAVIKEYRGLGLGSEMLLEAEDTVRKMGAKVLMLHAQCRVVKFYSTLGFMETGPSDDEEGLPHIWMQKKIR